jgi:hypothetical protein
MSMTAERAAYFLRRFKHDEKMLGPNEQAALDFAIAALATQRQAEPVASAADEVTDAQRMSWCSEHLVGVFQDVSEMFCITYLSSDGIEQTTERFNTLRQAIDAAMQKDTK